MNLDSFNPDDYELKPAFHSIRLKLDSKKSLDTLILFDRFFWAAAFLLSIVLFFLIIGPNILNHISYIFNNSSKKNLMLKQFGRLLFLLIFPSITFYSAQMLLKISKLKQFYQNKKDSGDVLKTFIESIKYGYWKIAFNCLTDMAQNGKIVCHNEDPYLKEIIRYVNKIDSKKSLNRHWSRFGYTTDFKLDQMKKKVLDKNLLLYEVPIEYSYTPYNQYGLARILFLRRRSGHQMERNSRSYFLLKKIADNWYLCNGYMIMADPD